MRHTIYTLMVDVDGLGEPVIEKPEHWLTMNQADRARWAMKARQEWEHSISLLCEIFLIDDLREEKG